MPINPSDKIRREKLVGTQGVCTECGSVYTFNKSANRKCNSCVSGKRRQDARAFLVRVRDEGECVVCGEGDPIVLQFHHVDPELKYRHSSGSHGIARLVAEGRGIKKIKEELTLCVLVCANCHLRIEAGVIDSTRLPRVCAGQGGY